MIKLIVFDLDGVLVDSKNIHFNAVNMALSEFDPKYVISMEEHLYKYDGLKTTAKLEILTRDRGLPTDAYESIQKRKQEITLRMLNNIKISEDIFNVIKQLSDDGYKIACCSNSVRKAVNTVLSKLNIIQFFDLILSNEDVENSKPHPEMYWKTISSLRSTPEETLIVEDSPFGLFAAEKSGSHILRVKSPEEVNCNNIMNAIENINKIKTFKNFRWVDKKMNIVIPMAGAGSRFQEAGYALPKPLIDVKGKPMIQVAVENINIDGNYIFIVQKEHRQRYNLDTIIVAVYIVCIVRT